MRLFLLGATRPLQWKVDVYQAAVRLGWDVTHQLDRGIGAEDVVRLVRGHDLFLWARTHGKVPAGNVRVMLGRIRKLRIPTVGLHLDLYYGLPRRNSEVGRDPWWSMDYVFTADGGHQGWFRDRGVNHFWCPPAMGLRFFGRGRVVDRFRHRLAFTGGCSSVFHGRHRMELLSWARRTYGRGFARYNPPGNGVYGSDLNDLYTSAGVVVGDSSPSPHYWSDRVPTVMGRGGMLAYPRTPGLTEQGFNEQNTILYNRFDFTGLKTQIEALTDQERKDRTEAALALIWDRHMWTHRLQQIERTVFG